MANLLTASIYRIEAPGGNTDISALAGMTNLFPVGLIHVYPTSATNSVQGAAQATCNAIIEVYAQGNNQPSSKFYTTATVAALLTLANAPLA